MTTLNLTAVNNPTIQEQKRRNMPKTQLKLYSEEWLIEALDVLAKDDGRSRNNYCNKILENHVRDKQEEK